MWSLDNTTPTPAPHNKQNSGLLHSRLSLHCVLLPDTLLLETMAVVKSIKYLLVHSPVPITHGTQAMRLLRSHLIRLGKSLVNKGEEGVRIHMKI